MSPKKKTGKWQCIEKCGACCRLAPNERQEAIAALSQPDQAEYMAMVANDGWCKHFNKVSKKCMIYEQRPSFCKVSNLTSLFRVEKNQFDAFAINCCKEQIISIYGPKSQQLKVFKETCSTN